MFEFMNFLALVNINSPVNRNGVSPPMLSRYASTVPPMTTRAFRDSDKYLPAAFQRPVKFLSCIIANRITIVATPNTVSQSLVR